MIEVLKQALEALYPISHNSTDDYRGQADKAITSLRQAIAELESQEPVGWCIWLCGGIVGFFDKQDEAIEEFRRRNQEYPDESRKLVPLYTHPPQRTEQEPVQEPVAWMVWGENNVPALTFTKPADKYVFDSLYTHPPQRTEQLKLGGASMTLIDKACFERGCACYDSRDKGECVEVVEKREWVGLTDDERYDIRASFVWQFLETSEFAEQVQLATEAKLKEKNT